MLGSGPYSNNQQGYTTPTGYPLPSGPMRPLPRNTYKTAMWAHLGMLLTWAGGFIFWPAAFFGWVVPLVLRSNHPNDPFVRHHATQALNCALTDLLIGVGAIILIFLGIFVNLGPAATIIAVLLVLVNNIARIVYAIIGSAKANTGQQFCYPLWIAFKLLRDDTSLATPEIPAVPAAHD